MCLLGCDIGSSSVKASIVDKDTGLTLASDFYPKEEAAIKAVRPGWAEQNPDDWWMYLKEAIKGAIAKAGIKGTEIDAIGISYQMHGLVLVDKKMQVLRPAIRETTALGAAYLAGLATGVWKDRDEIRSLWHCNMTFAPQMDEAERTRLLSGWHKAVGRSCDWAEH